MIKNVHKPIELYSIIMYKILSEDYMDIKYGNCITVEEFNKLRTI